jgi:hypothetical protein
LLISSRSISKHGRHRQFLFLIGRFLKIFSSETAWPNDPKIGRKHLWKEEKIFRNRPIRNKNCLWRPCLVMDRDEMSNLYRGPSKDAPYQVSIQLAKWFQRRFFRNQPIIKDCSFRPDPLPNMAATGNYCFWLADLKKSFLLKPFGQIIRNLVGSIYGRSSINFANFVPSFS